MNSLKDIETCVKILLSYIVNNCVCSNRRKIILMFFFQARKTLISLLLAIRTDLSLSEVYLSDIRPV